MKTPKLGIFRRNILRKLRKWLLDPIKARAVLIPTRTFMISGTTKCHYNMMRTTCLCLHPLGWALSKPEKNEVPLRNTTHYSWTWAIRIGTRFFTQLQSLNNNMQMLTISAFKKIRRFSISLSSERENMFCMLLTDSIFKHARLWCRG